MKKILVVAIALIASVFSYGQGEYGSSAEWNKFYSQSTPKKTNDQPEKTDSKISIVEYSNDGSNYISTNLQVDVEKNYIKIIGPNITKTFLIESVYQLPNGPFYKCYDSINLKEIVEIQFYSKDKLILVSVGVLSVTGPTLIERTYLNYGEPKKTDIKQFQSIGIVGGYSTNFNNFSAGSAAWGVYVDFGGGGLEFHHGVGANYNTNDAMNYLNGTASKYVAGSQSFCLGGFMKLSPTEPSSFYLGGGILQYSEITTSSLKDNKAVLPYGTIGFISKINNSYTFKIGAILSKKSMFNLGFGFNLKN